MEVAYVWPPWLTGSYHPRSDVALNNVPGYSGAAGGQVDDLEIYQLVHNAAQEWVFYPRMTREEVMVFKTYDSLADPFVPTMHSAFDHPDCPPGVCPRESVECRVICFFKPTSLLGKARLGLAMLRARL